MCDLVYVFGVLRYAFKNVSVGGDGITHVVVWDGTRAIKDKDKVSHCNISVEFEGIVGGVADTIGSHIYFNDESHE